VDLLRIASSVYVVDRLVRRRLYGRMKSASRAIALTVPVFQPTFWNRKEVLESLVGALDFVGGDHWKISFSQDTGSYARLGRIFTSPTEGMSPQICLFSGGLDSAAGLANRLLENFGRPIVPVTVWHQPRQRHQVLGQFKYLRSKFAAQID